MHEFIVDGTKFQLKPLKLKQALKAQSILVNAALPAFFAAFSLRQGVSKDSVGSLVAGLERLDELVEIFASVTDYERVPGAAMLPVRTFLDEIFERRNAALLAWLVECVAWQFADFFGGTGLRLLEERASLFISLLGSTGESGESSSTSD